MRQKQLRSCVIEVRSLGPSRALIACGVARAPASGTGRLIVRINVKPKGKTLLSKNYGGVIANVRALCRSTSGTLRRDVKKVRVVLLVEHRLTPPGSWVPDQPILTGIGHSFMSFLRQRMFRVRSIQCDGYTATWVPSPAFPPTLSLNRAKRVCAEMERVGGAKARVRLRPARPRRSDRDQQHRAWPPCQPPRLRHHRPPVRLPFLSGTLLRDCASLRTLSLSVRTRSTESFARRATAPRPSSVRQ